MVSDLGILYGIIAGVVIFGVICVYLIYNFVQEDKRAYSKYILQREHLAKNPVDYDLLPPKERKASPPKMEVVKEDESSDKPAIIPLPAPLLAPVVLPPLPTPSPTVVTSSENTNTPPASDTTNKDDDVIIATAATTAAAVAATGGAAAVTSATYDLPPKEEPKPKETKPKVKEIQPETNSDFDDYRNFSPTNLPPPKGPPPPKAAYQPAPNGNTAPVSSGNNVSSVEIDRPRKPRNGVMDYPRVAVASTQGLEF